MAKAIASDSFGESIFHAKAQVDLFRCSDCRRFSLLLGLLTSPNA
jgi:hypothetical protein